MVYIGYEALLKHFLGNSEIAEIGFSLEMYENSSDDN